MKTYQLICVSFLCTTSYAQNANQNLSNLLSPTAVNQSLLPSTDNTLNLGSSAKSWKYLYIDGAVYLNGNRFLANGGNTNNLFVGTKAGNANTGDANTFAGAFAGGSNTTGHDNTAVGFFAMYSNAITYENTAVGSQSLFSNSSGYYNTAIGYRALYDNQAGYYNTAIGTQALDATLTSNNTALGERAGAIYKNGHGTTFIGQQTWANADGYQNSTCLGFDSHITASNQVRIGSNTVTSIGGYRAWSNLSDGRFKKNIKENVPGLAFINKLRPVTYNLDVIKINQEFEKTRPKTNIDGKEITYPGYDKAAIAEQEKIISTGFVAQEVEKTAKELNYDFDGVDAPKNKNDFYGLRYSEFVVPLVKAVQELSQQNDELKKEIQELKALVSNQSSANTQPSTVVPLASLQQNIPNPFNSTTSINYTLPKTYSSAKMIVIDKAGKVLKEINISGSGKGSLQLDASTLASGAYQYSFYVNGKLVDAKQMLISK